MRDSKQGSWLGLLRTVQKNPCSSASTPFASLGSMPQMELENLTETPLPRLRARDSDSHKGDFGRALLIGGSRGMSGAISLSGRATLRSGAGLVTLAVPRSVQDIV